MQAQPIAFGFDAARLFDGRPVNVREIERPMLSDDVETAQTIHLMDSLAWEDAAHRSVIDATQRALAESGCTLTSSRLDKAVAVYWWLKRNIRYVPTAGTSPLVDQTLIPPATLLAMRDPEGDCPQFSMLASAMLRVCCVPCQYVTIAADPQHPDTFTHVYNRVQVARDQFIPFDSSNGPAPGAEYAHQFKRRVWPQLHQDRCKEMLRNEPMPSGTRNYVLRNGLDSGRMGALFQALSGTMGFYDDEGNWVPDDLMTGPAVSLNDPRLNIDSSSGSMPTSGGPSIWSGLAANLVNDAASIGSQLIRQQTAQPPRYVTNPVTGQSVLYNPNTGQVMNTGAAGVLSSISPNYIVLGLAAIAAFALIQSRK